MTCRYQKCGTSCPSLSLNYTDLKGLTHAVVTDDTEGKESAALITQIMLHDIDTVQAGLEKSKALSSIQNITNGLYKKAFEFVLQEIGVRCAIMSVHGVCFVKKATKVDLSEACVTMSNDRQMLNEMLCRLEDAGLHPSSKAYADVLHARYYVDAWYKQLCALTAMTRQGACQEKSCSCG